MKLSGTEIRDMLRMNTRLGLSLIKGERPRRTAQLVARSLCDHRELESTELVNHRWRFRCMACGASAVHREQP